MFKIMIYTSVWLDMAKEPQQQLLLSVLEKLVGLKEVEILLPRIVLDEFQRHRQRIIEDSRRSLSSVFKRVKEAVEKYGDVASRKKVLRELNNIDSRLPTLGEAVADSMSRIETLFAGCSIIETEDAVKLRAAERALQTKAPFHGKKNSMADAILVEIYADCVRASQSVGHRFVFVTHNVNDFSDTRTNNKLPHPDIAGIFTRIKSLYFINIGDALRRARPDLVSEIVAELGEWEQPMRTVAEIMAVEDELTDKIWYDRHQGLKDRVESGKTPIVEKETFPTPKGQPRPIQRDIWEGARAAARRVEERYGAENLGPWSDFEWGMINGKLSAIRWVLGFDWDMLDT